MVKFDRVYVPALVFTDLFRQRESEIALADLKKEWQRFYDKYHGMKMKYGVDIVDKRWPQDFDLINNLIASAEVCTSDELLIPAYASLEAVRFVLADIRKRNSLHYFLDYLNDFDATMGQMSLTVRSKTRLEEKDLKKLKNLSEQARLEWQIVGQASLEAKLFNFDELKVEALKERIKKEEQVLESLDRALKYKNQQAIFQSIQNIKAEFVVIYKAFGDFGPVFERVLEEKGKQNAPAN